METDNMRIVDDLETLKAKQIENTEVIEANTEKIETMNHKLNKIINDKDINDRKIKEIENELDTISEAATKAENYEIRVCLDGLFV